MKNVIGLEYYREYQKQLEEMRHQVMENRSENDCDSALLLVHNDEAKQTITKIFGITAFAVFVLIGILLGIFKDIHRFDLVWILFVILAVWGILFIVLFKINKEKRDEILEEKAKKDQMEKTVVEKFSELQEKFYEIVVYVVCINEYYHTLINLQGEERTKKWKEITDRQIEAINNSIGYNINIESYQQYFNAWLAKQEIYG